ncbi:MAG: 1-deoxy-D-xylulose-5-phosphate reductoisomerase [Lactobacillales bacterium]|jgi:1-deoxy-D-xylulose-5-phosphate reductoisomerase|nr:1-deoxy-D-xylulose-5-phosphate reductoisomerase [Lactobacillales bacterium]
MKKKISLLGATGSIGKSTLDVLRNNPEMFELVAFSFYSNIELAKKIIEEFQPKIVGVRDQSMAQTLTALYPKVEFIAELQGLIAVATAKDVKIVLTALIGSVGLLPTMAAIKNGKDIALANKEILVMAGYWVMQAAKENDVKILPVDSEHSAIFQVLQGQDMKNIKELVITASGGSFRDLTREELKQVTLEDALQHPNWAMGKKITIDSSTMVNKGLEVIEAHWLFNASYDKIKVVLHRESTVHSMIRLVDGAYFAQLGASDMREPIQYALTFPNRRPLKKEKVFDIADVAVLHFDKLDKERFPMLALAFAVGVKGGSFPTVFNAANEVAVNAFIAGKIKYLEIENLIQRAVAKHQEKENLTLEMVIEIDKQTRQKVYERIKL